VLILLCYQIFDNHTIVLLLHKKLVKIAHFATKNLHKKRPGCAESSQKKWNEKERRTLRYYHI